MKVTVETINGTPCTVIRRPFDAEAVRKSLAIGVPVVVEHKTDGICAVTWRNLDSLAINRQLSSRGYGAQFKTQCHSTFEHIVTILPPLPRNPKPEDAALLYRYAAEGIYAAFGRYQFAHMDADGELYVYGNAGLVYPATSAEITHAVTADGQRVEVVIV